MCRFIRLECQAILYSPCLPISFRGLRRLSAQSTISSLTSSHQTNTYTIWTTRLSNMLHSPKSSTRCLPSSQKKCHLGTRGNLPAEAIPDVSLIIHDLRISSRVATSCVPSSSEVNPKTQQLHHGSAPPHRLPAQGPAYKKLPYQPQIPEPRSKDVVYQTQKNGFEQVSAWFMWVNRASLPTGTGRKAIEGCIAYSF